jgi:CRP/FNR family cyclic AMP-dependent transcriptional regulator
MISKNTLGKFFKAGETIIKQGTVGNCLYIIQKGKVEVIEETPSAEIKVAELKKKDFFGEMSLFEKDVRSCTVKALSDVKVLTLDKRSFYNTIQKDPSLAFRLLEKMSNRLRKMNEKLGSQNLSQT